MNKEILDRLWSHSSIDKTTFCWLWNGTLSGDGYGRINIGGKLYGVHRVSAALYLGLNLEDNTIHSLHYHHCPNRNCWNPEHLHLGTNEQNHAERLPKTHCPKGHEYIAENIYINPKLKMECKICRLDRNRVYKQKLREKRQKT